MPDPFPEFSAYQDVRVVAVRRAAEEQVWFDVERPPGFTENYRSPGQFCRLRYRGMEGIFAMYTAPGETVLGGARARHSKEDEAVGTVRFLVRLNGPLPEALCSAPSGATVEMTLPAGGGFDLSATRHRDVVLVATGTGVAPVRAALEVLLRNPERHGKITLDYGLRHPHYLAIEDDLAHYRAAGVEVHLAYSRLDADGRLRGMTVQRALERRAPDLRRAAVLAVGQEAMLDSLRQVVEALGCPNERFLTNC